MQNNQKRINNIYFTLCLLSCMHSWASSRSSTPENINPLIRAADYSDAKALIDNGVSVPSDILVNNTSCEDDAFLTQLFIAYGADVNAQDICGNTLLHNACCENVVCCLLHYKANPNIKNNEGKTAADEWAGNILRGRLDYERNLHMLSLYRQFKTHQRSCCSVS